MSAYNLFGFVEEKLPVSSLFIFGASDFASPAIVSISGLLNFLDRMAYNGAAVFRQPLNSSDVIRTIQSRERKRTREFFDPANLERVGRRAGKFDFVRQLTHMIENPRHYAGREGERKKLRMMQFISDAYNDHIGAPRTTVKLFNGTPNQCGYFNHGSSIYINRNDPAFNRNFAALINTVVHENTHNAQANPNIYSDPVLSRIYRANFQAYRNPAQHGMHAYRWQPVEAGAFAAGDMAEAMLGNLTSANDNFLHPSPRRGVRQYYRLAA